MEGLEEEKNQASTKTSDGGVVEPLEDDQEEDGILQRLRRRILLPVEESDYAPRGTRWSNKDLDPVPSHMQTWRTWTFVAYWISDAFSISNWRIGASLISIGLSWQLALVAVFVGNLVTAAVVTFNGVIGARLHIPFSVQARSAFGFYFSYVMVVVRVIVSVFWYGIGTYTGAECVRSIIYAWAPNFRNIPNALPASANIDTGFMICYLIYFLLVLPFHYVPVHRVHWLFLVKAVACPLAGFAIVGWVVHSTGGGSAVFQFGSEYSGARLGWAFMSGVNAMIGNFATLGVNMNDFARYAKDPRSPYVQLLVIPVVFMVVMLFGVIGANGSRLLYGEVLWDPMLIIDNWTSPGGRAAAFFIALAFLVANIAINISANSVAVAVDLSTLFPRYLNLRRAQFVCAFIGAWALTPWNIMQSAESLLTFMDGYSIWLGPISGILLADYWIVNRQRVNVLDMYNPQGMYAYERWGTNWRAFAAFFIGFVPLLPGFAAAVNAAGVQIDPGASHLYALGYWYGFLVSSTVYICLSLVWPPRSEVTGKMLKESLEADS